MLSWQSQDKRIFSWHHWLARLQWPAGLVERCAERKGTPVDVAAVVWNGSRKHGQNGSTVCKNQRQPMSLLSLIWKNTSLQGGSIIKHLNYRQLFVELDEYHTTNLWGPSHFHGDFCFAFLFHTFEGRRILVSQGACTAGAAPAPTANLRWALGTWKSPLDHHRGICRELNH